MSEIILNIDSVDLSQLYGTNNINIQLLQEAYPDITITFRGNVIKLSGDKKSTQACKHKIELMVRALKEHNELQLSAVRDMLLQNENNTPPDGRISQQDHTNNVIVYGREGTPIKAKTRNQKKLVRLSEDNDVVFAIGPAGTGKTYTAVALAVRALKSKMVKKIILTRPAVEAGENLGFLPGDLKEKIDPYLRPLYDALDDMIPAEKFAQFVTNRIIEIAPLAFMRGRTLDNAFIILDEAQNATKTQLKMFLTRIGPSAKCIITGDLTQIDLPMNQVSGLYRSIETLSEIPGIGIVYLNEEDVVRHPLVKSIIKAFNKIDTEDHVKEAREKQERLRIKAERQLQYFHELQMQLATNTTLPPQDATTPTATTAGNEEQPF